MTDPRKQTGSVVNPPSGGFRAVVIGVSAGGLQALGTLLPALPRDFPLPVLIVQHRPPGSDDFLTRVLNDQSAAWVKEAEEKEPLRAGCVYIAPADYHLLVERDETLCLTIDPKVNFSRPAIDVLFESAASVWATALIGVILTGSNDDGARGMARIKENGGLTIAQDPATAAYPAMPQAAIHAAAVEYVLPLEKIGPFLNNMVTAKIKSHTHNHECKE